MVKFTAILAVCALLALGGAKAQTYSSPADAVTKTRSLSTLLAAVTATDLVPYLSNPTANITVLAPTNSAFANAASALSLTPEALLRSSSLGTILRYHAILGAVPSSALTDGQVLTTLLGQQLRVGKSGSTVTFTGQAGPANIATVQIPDIAAGNSIVHVINTVLLPSLSSAPAGAPASDSAYAAAVRVYQAGLAPAPAPVK